MKSSKTTLENLNNNLNYLEWYIDSENSDVIEGCKKQVQDLEKIINELIKETVQLNKKIKKQEMFLTIKQQEVFKMIAS